MLAKSKPPKTPPEELTPTPEGIRHAAAEIFILFVMGGLVAALILNTVGWLPESWLNNVITISALVGLAFLRVTYFLEFSDKKGLLIFLALIFLVAVGFSQIRENLIIPEWITGHNPAGSMGVAMSLTLGVITHLLTPPPEPTIRRSSIIGPVVRDIVCLLPAIFYLSF